MSIESHGLRPAPSRKNIATLRLSSIGIAQDFRLSFGMSKQPSGRRANEPIVPQVSIDTWKALFAAADDFNRLAPWKWMHDSQIIGLRHPITNEVWLGSILGRLRSMFALLVYRND